MTEKEMREIGIKGRKRILEKIREAKIRMSNPEYRKRHYSFPEPEEEKVLLHYLEK